MAANPDTAELLANSALFGSLTVADREAVAARMRPSEYATGQLIFSRGDEGRDIYLVTAGRVRLSILTGDGRELSLVHATTGDIFGEIAALDGGVRTADATAITKVALMSLPRAAMATLVETNSRIAQAAIAFVCSRLRETDLKLEGIALHSIEVRLARFLLSALQLQTPGAKGEAVPLDLGMSQSELALLIGASRSKVNIALSMLEETGAVTRKGAKLECNTEILQGYADPE